MRLKNVPFKKSLKDELRKVQTPNKSNEFKDLGLKNPEGTVYKDDLSETKKIPGVIETDNGQEEIHKDQSKEEVDQASEHIASEHPSDLA